MTINLNRLSLSLDPLNLAINAMVEQASLAKHASDQPRPHLGASLIGHECLRAIQFSLMTGDKVSARVRSIFERGHRFEEGSRTQLIEAGFVFEPSTEKLRFSAVDGLMGGTADGVVLGVPAGVELAVPALWEHKGLNAQNFRAVERDGLTKIFPRYVVQTSLYQAFLNVTNPALVTVCNANSCERLHLTVPFDARLAQEASDRAIMVIEATRAGELLSRFDQSLEDWRCKMCSHLERCRRYV